LLATEQANTELVARKPGERLRARVRGLASEIAAACVEDGGASVICANIVRRGSQRLHRA
jgi:hypothetical protein